MMAEPETEGGERRFLPQQGTAASLVHYLEMAKGFADEVGAATLLLDCLLDIYRRAVAVVGDRDVAAILELFEPQSGPARRVYRAIVDTADLV